METKMILIVERGDDSSSISGRIYYGDDLLTTAGDSIEEVEQNMRDQFEAFYQLDPSKIEFEIVEDEGLE